MNIDKFTKLMQMTLSPNDNESLAALRIANTLLNEADLNWAEFIEQRSRSRAKPPPQPQPSQQPRFSASERAEIDRMFEKVGGSARGTFRDFINSLRKQWAANGSLSARQLAALKNAYVR